MIRYVNHLGQEIMLTQPPYMAEGGNLIDYDWSLETATRLDRRGGRVASFGRGVIEKQLNIQIWAHTRAEFVTAVNALHDVFEADIEALQPGTLYVGNAYVKCYASASAKSEWYDGADYMVNTITFAVESACWSTEETYSFTVFETGGGTGLKFPGRFPAKFCRTGGVQVITNAHYADTPVRITIYGPAVNPTFTVGEHIYSVTTELISGERLVIDQIASEVYKITNSGERINEFNNRNKVYSIFQPFPPGELSVYYSGQFAFEITLIAQRSEPTWQ